nr:MAG TPA: hypothetical protein [Caudoviricetes sp.]
MRSLMNCCILLCREDYIKTLVNKNLLGLLPFPPA